MKTIRAFNSRNAVYISCISEYSYKKAKDLSQALCFDQLIKTKFKMPVLEIEFPRSVEDLSQALFLNNYLQSKNA